MTVDAGSVLRQLGWPSAVPLPAAVRAFQSSTGLKVDGIVGPLTSARMDAALQLHRAGRPDLSTHFSFREFACECRGRYAAQGCVGVLVVPALVVGLEDLRTAVVRGPLALDGAYRCPRHNAETDGAANGSQHQYGAAADLPATIRLAVVVGRHTFSGVGYQGPLRADAGLVRHVDVRHASGHNPTHSTTSAPALWTYA